MTLKFLDNKGRETVTSISFSQLLLRFWGKQAYTFVPKKSFYVVHSEYSVT